MRRRYSFLFSTVAVAFLFTGINTDRFYLAAVFHFLAFPLLPRGIIEKNLSLNLTTGQGKMGPQPFCSNTFQLTMIVSIVIAHLDIAAEKSGTNKSRIFAIVIWLQFYSVCVDTLTINIERFYV